MKSTGIVRRIDSVGRIVIPVEIRTTLGIEIGDPLEILTDEHTVVLKKYQPTCVFCQSPDGLKEYKGRLVCRACAAEIGKLKQN